MTSERDPEPTGSYRRLFRDDALVLGLIALDGRNREVRLHDVVAHVLAHGYAGPRGGRSSAIYFACRWLARHGKPVRGFVITSSRRGYYRLEKATQAQIASWRSDVAKNVDGIGKKDRSWDAERHDGKSDPRPGMKVKADGTAYREQLEILYRRFFRDMEIDLETGTTPLQADRKFAAYPYIGSRYDTDPDIKKLLVVGLDIGSDETPGRLQHFEERRQAIECTLLPALNAHIAGTYFTALRYAFPGQAWDHIRDRDQTCQAILKDGYARRNNPLSYIALTNFYKWVTQHRRNKGGAKDRTLVDPRLETTLFLEEVRLLAPQVVVFQGVEFCELRFRQVRDSITPAVEWHVLPHPSNRERGGRQPKRVTHPLLSGASHSNSSYET